MGFEKAGHECIYSIEWDKFKRGIYNVIFGELPQGSDIRECRADDIPQADCWAFGAPCQDFSIGGARAGLEGDRSSLVREVFRLVRETKKEYRPKWLLYENVAGMFSSNKGLDYFQILFEMESLGYDIEWQMLNSKEFGVPHNRERVFTLGHLRGRGGRKVFPIRGISSEVSIKVIGSTVNNIAQGTNSRHWVHDITGIVGALSATDYKQPKQIYIKEATKKGYAEATEGDSINLEHPNSKTRRGRVGHQQANTLTTSCNQATVTQGRIRRLTPKECWRLQGIDDSITDKVIAAGISDMQMYRGAGDACTVNVIYEIAKRLI